MSHPRSTHFCPSRNNVNHKPPSHLPLPSSFSRFGSARIVETKNTVSPTRLLVDPRKAKEIHDRNTSPRSLSEGSPRMRSPKKGKPDNPTSRRLSFVDSHSKGKVRAKGGMSIARLFRLGKFRGSNKLLSPQYLPLSPPSLSGKVEKVTKEMEGMTTGSKKSIHDKNLMHVKEVERKVKVVKEKRGEKREKMSKVNLMREEAKKMIVRRRVMKMLGLVKFEGDLNDLYKLAKERDDKEKKKRERGKGSKGGGWSNRKNRHHRIQNCNRRN